ncbi:MAG: DUF2294 domain-containing protein [Actinomycetota bacterium]|nr:DUF2294 domain-containing protein [Actinomycetota bacterium]
MTDYPAPLAAEAEERLQGGRLHAAISNRVVQIQREYIGRGPTKARTFIHDNLVAVLLQDALTKAERSLAADGKGDTVLGMRHQFQNTMRSDLTAAIEELTGRRVVAFLSDNHIDPDIGVEAFVLEEGLEGQDAFAAADGGTG